MADKEQKRTVHQVPDDDKGETAKINSTTGLQNFITEQYEQQKTSGAMQPCSELDDERTAKFFNRALGESQRMSQEVVKSKEKLEKLKAEFGDEMITMWRNEHATEVLTEPEQQAVQQAESGAYA